jgi:hypothetical protein
VVMMFRSTHDSPAILCEASRVARERLEYERNVTYLQLYVGGLSTEVQTRTNLFEV